ncbi:hypothetical protein WN71_017570 [Streptomyces mangrovisoli]|uniref:Uncharacterized protein n=1 Tax=Streptomyces mangrovisoli TaxID=1428628 RepID=A0A1J4NZ47_9ACTN|nr:hypothetical protein WN71_017570 [Streptomyces mangrovisoli]
MRGTGKRAESVDPRSALRGAASGRRAIRPPACRTPRAVIFVVAAQVAARFGAYGAGNAG